MKLFGMVYDTTYTNNAVLEAYAQLFDDESRGTLMGNILSKLLAAGTITQAEYEEYMAMI